MARLPSCVTASASEAPCAEDHLSDNHLVLRTEGGEMKRREMIMALFAVVTAGIPQTAWSQETKIKKPTKIGFIPLGSSSNPYDQSLVETFRQGLKRVGLVEHRDVELDVVWPTEGADKAISELLQRGADMLITCGTSTSVAAKHQTGAIPIVFISFGNP